MKKALNILTIIGSIASIIALTIYFRPNKPNTIVLENTYSEILTGKKIRQPKFEVKYFYDSIEVSNLLNYELSILNQSGHTLIGKGQQSDLIYNKLTLPIDTTYQLISLRDKTDGIIDSMGYDSNKIEIEFTQFKNNTSLDLELFLEYKSDYNKVPTNEELFRQIDANQIVDGRFKFQTPLHQTLFERISTSIPSQPKKISILISLLMLYMILLALLISGLQSIFSWYRVRDWKARFGGSLESRLSMHGFPNGDISRYLSNPETIPSNVWNKLNLRRFPLKHHRNIKSKRPVLFQIIVLILMFLAFSVAIVELHNIYQGI